MLHETRDRQKFVSDVQYLRDMQHKVDSEYQACLKRQDYKKDTNDKKQDQLWGKDTGDRSRFPSGSSSKQSSSEEDSLSEPRTSTKICKCEPRLPAIDQTPVKQKHKSTMTPKKPDKVSPSKPSSGDSSEHPLFCVEYSPYCSVFAFSPTLQPNTNYCCLLLPLVPPASPRARSPSPSLPPVVFPTYTSPSSSPPRPLPGSPASLCYFPVSQPTPAETPVLCLPGPRRPSKIYLVW
uniref:RING-type E3 ubiquitin transferase n=1 Tax=Cricetulus griseus TaxID=10029 RepID=A0A8C2MFW0_CRIGR